MSWVGHVAGLDDAAGGWYLFWSGIGGHVVSGVTGGTAVAATFWRRHNCHIHRCWRLGRHHAVDADGAVHVVCARHHPRGAPRAADLVRRSPVK